MMHGRIRSVGRAILAVALILGATTAAGAATLLAQAEPALQPVSGDFATTANANVRELPQAGAKLVMTLPKGTVVQGVGKVADGSWHKVAFKGVPVGYISSELLLALSSGTTAAAAPAAPAQKPAASSQSGSNVPGLPSASGAAATAGSTAQTTTSSTASTVPGLPSAEGGTQPATQQATAPQPAAEPAAPPAPKVERYVANYRVWIYNQPQPNATRRDYYVEEQSFDTYGESDDGQWLKVKRTDGSEGWVYRLQVRRPGETRSGRIKVEPSQGSIKLKAD